ncbi:MAG: hypothetical protein V1776_04800 [Candidatus Diapherotrites archaeon]
MATKRNRKRTILSQTFDPDTFDIHANEKSFRRNVFPSSRNESIARVKEDLRYFKGEMELSKTKENRSILIALLSNIIVPGLGNVYIRATPFSVSILILSILVIFTTFSPIFPIVGLLSAANIASPSSPENATLSLVVPSNVVVENQLLLVGPTFSVLAIPLLLSWIHLLFLFLNSTSRIHWKP